MSRSNGETGNKHDGFMGGDVMNMKKKVIFLVAMFLLNMTAFSYRDNFMGFIFWVGSAYIAAEFLILPRKEEDPNRNRNIIVRSASYILFIMAAALSSIFLSYYLF